MVAGAPPLAVVVGSGAHQRHASVELADAKPFDVHLADRALVDGRSVARAASVPQQLTAQTRALEAAVAYLQAHPPRSAAHRVSRSAPLAASANARFQWPHKGIITGPFGEPRPGGPHPGIDINGHIGEPVYAAADGIVVIAGAAPAGFEGYGNLVVIDHGNGVVSMYAHLSRIDAKPGTLITTGTLLGAIGTTGQSTGPHLHFEVRINDTPVDPIPLLPPQ